MKKILSILICLFFAVGAAAGFGCSEREGEILGYPPKAEIRAKHFDVIDTSDMTPSEKLTVSCLQGLITRYTDQQIYITNNFGDNGVFQPYQLWLDKLVADHGVTYDTTSDAFGLIKKNLGYVDGYIVCRVGDSSMNVATSYAGVRNALVVDRGMEARLKQETELEKMMDVTGLDETVFTQEVIEREGFSKEIAFEIGPHVMPYSRDYAVMNGAVCFWVGIYGERENMMKNLDLQVDGIIMGYGDFSITGNENDFIKMTCEAGYHYLAADSSLNYSVLSGFESKYSYYRQSTPKTVEPEENVHYVTFIMSDGDNLQWSTANRVNSPKWWGDPARGNAQMTWGFSASLLDIAPVAVDWYYEHATPKDDFCIATSEGFIFPSYMTDEALDMNTRRLNDYMGRLDMNVCTILGFDSYAAKDELWLNYLDKENIDGLIYFEWGLMNTRYYAGDIRWVNNKPILTGGAHLNAMDDHNAEHLVERIRTGSRDVTKAGAYTVVYVDCWQGANRLSEVEYLCSLFPEDVRVVNSSQMIDAVTRNVVHESGEKS